MKSSSRRASRTNSLVCPACDTGKLRAWNTELSRCDSCGHALSGALLETLRQIVALPDAAGAHACECGHPEMRLLPDGVFHCPACGSEVLPAESGAYQAGWMDGYYGEIIRMAHNDRLARWQEGRDRLDYYRGHRAGRKARLDDERFPKAS